MHATRWRDDLRATARARAGDLGCIFAALVLGVGTTNTIDVPGWYVSINVLIGLVATASLWWRRRAPLAVACFTFAAAAVAPMAAGATLFSIYTLAANRERKVAVGAVGAVGALYVASAVSSNVLFPDRQGDYSGVLWGMALGFAAFGWGLAVRFRKRLQAARIEEARRVERTRIASEMHDVLAHRLSMLSLYAGAIEFRPGSSPEHLADAAGVIRSSAHLALEELRAVIGVLRDDAPDAADVAPLPSAADLPALVEECRAAGMRIEFTDAVREAGTLPPDLGRNAYRIVQEGLTNARKHASGQPVRLAVTGSPGEGLHIEITNPTSAPGIAGPAGPAGPAIPGAGLGLIGLSERVKLVGGTLDAGTEVTDGLVHHRLRAWLPWPT